jgi:hypothetical protein
VCLREKWLLLPPCTVFRSPRSRHCERTQCKLGSEYFQRFTLRGREVSGHRLTSSRAKPSQISPVKLTILVFAQGQEAAIVVVVPCHPENLGGHSHSRPRGKSKIGRWSLIKELFLSPGMATKGVTRANYGQLFWVPARWTATMKARLRV